MRYILILVLLMAGCMTPEVTHEERKRTLEEQIEILRLEKRRALLEFQLDELDTKVE